MIWEFHELEKYHKIPATFWNYQVVGNEVKGSFRNDPRNQRLFTCKDCKMKVPREVPRFKIAGCYYYEAGNYCPECGRNKLKNEIEGRKVMIERLEKQMESMQEVIGILEETIKHPFYRRKMALGKLIKTISD